MNNRVNHELFQRHAENPILVVDDWSYPVNSVFNPAVTVFKDQILLLIRAEDFRGHSHLTVARSDDGVRDWQIDGAPTMVPEYDRYAEEMWGIEDPRITRVDELDQWVIAYTAFSDAGPLVSLATTSDFQRFERIGSVMPPENKDAALFPKKIKGR